jgi:hypothetical protein
LGGAVGDLNTSKRYWSPHKVIHGNGIWVRNFLSLYYSELKWKLDDNAAFTGGKVLLKKFCIDADLAFRHPWGGEER